MKWKLLKQSENMYEEKPLYIGMYFVKTPTIIEYTFYIGSNLPNLYAGVLVRKLKVPKKYIEILKSHLNNKSFAKLGLISFGYSRYKGELVSNYNFPLSSLMALDFEKAKNTGLGSFLMLMASAHLKRNGILGVHSPFAPSLSGAGQLKKAGLEKNTFHKIDVWQKGIAKNVRFAKRKLLR